MGKFAFELILMRRTAGPLMMWVRTRRRWTRSASGYDAIRCASAICSNLLEGKRTYSQMAPRLMWFINVNGGSPFDGCVWDPPPLNSGCFWP
jgi:hypothetical protein